MIVVLMGVCGCGKTTVGRALAERLGWEYIEGDELHSAANVEKMRAGEPLTDEDRWPWLDRIALELARRQRQNEGVVLGCSALRRDYRGRLESRGAEPLFVHLTAPRELIARRLEARKGHYMPPTLLESQLSTLEPPLADERSISVSVDGPFEEIVATLIQRLEQASLSPGSA